MLVRVIERIALKLATDEPLTDSEQRIADAVNFDTQTLDGAKEHAIPRSSGQSLSAP